MRYLVLLIAGVVTTASFAEFDKAEFDFSYGFLHPRLYGRMEKIEKILNDPTMKPADYSRALTYLCQEMKKSIYTDFADDQKKYCIEVAKKLIAKGANINTVNKVNTALRSSMMEDSDTYFDFLLENGADPNLANSDGQTPLMFAVFKEDRSDNEDRTKCPGFYFTDALLNAGAKINATNKAGKNALHVAAYWGNTGAARCLIKNGIALNAKDKDGLTPIQIAKIHNQGVVATILRQAGAKDTPVPAKYLAAQKKNAEISKKAEAQAESDRAKAKSEANSVHNQNVARELEGIMSQLNRKAAEIQQVESEMSAIGWSGSSFYTRTVTGYQCDVNNQNCHATYQGGGETVSSQWRRIDNEHKKRSLELKHRILVSEYDSLAHKYNEKLKKLR